MLIGSTGKLVQGIFTQIKATGNCFKVSVCDISNAVRLREENRVFDSRLTGNWFPPVDLQGDTTLLKSATAFCLFLLNSIMGRFKLIRRPGTHQSPRIPLKKISLPLENFSLSKHRQNPILAKAGGPSSTIHLVGLELCCPSVVIWHRIRMWTPLFNT